MRDRLLMVLRSGAEFLATGVAVSLLACLACERLIADQFRLLTSHDPIPMMAGVILILLVGVAACWRSAQRTSHVDPITELRSE